MSKRRLAGALPEFARPLTNAQAQRTRASVEHEPWLRLVNLADAGGPSVTELWIYDYIDWLGITADAVRQALSTVATDAIRVRINSPGGDVFDGIAISNILLAHPAQVDVVIDALCASIATVIAMAGDTITISPGGQMMIHPASGVCQGNAADMIKLASILDLQTKNIARMYAQRAGGTEAEWLDRMTAETWLLADEAVELGLADATGVVASGGAQADLSGPSWSDGWWDVGGRKFAAVALNKIPAIVTPPKALLLPVRCPCAQAADAAALLAAKHTGACVLAVTDATPTIGPVTVMWDFVVHPSDSVAGTCDECQALADASPYSTQDFPEFPHPGCECTQEPASVDYGDRADTKLTFDAESFRRDLQEACA